MESTNTVSKPQISGRPVALARPGGRVLGPGSTPPSFLLVGIAVVLTLLSAVGLAQNYSIAWWTTDGGGGTSADGDYSLSGTIGQSVAGTAMTNGEFSLNGGFWALPVAIQSPGAPLLAIVPAGPGQARISWAPGTTGFVLQFSTTLNSPAWTNAPSGVTNPVVVPATLPTAFYRLIKP